jgi:hypothetical protein
MKLLFVFFYECRGNMAHNGGSWIAGDFLSSRKKN